MVKQVSFLGIQLSTQRRLLVVVYYSVLPQAVLLWTEPAYVDAA